MLQRRRCGRVVGRHHRQCAVFQRAPQRLALRARAQGRRAFRERAEPLGVVLVEDEVVRAGLAAHVDAARAGLGHERDAAAGRDVDDVQGAAGLLGEGEARAIASSSATTGREAR